MTDRRRAILEAVAIVASLALGGLLEHARGGIERLFLALGLVLAGPIFRRWLVAQGRAAGAPLVAFACEVLAFSGLVVYPIGRWAHALAGIAALATALPSLRGRHDEGPRATPFEEAAALATGAASLLAWLLVTTDLGTALVPIVLVGVEAYGPGAPRGALDAARRTSGFALSGAAALAYGQEHDRTGLSAEAILLVLALVAAFGAAREALVRAPRPTAPPEAGRARTVLPAFFGLAVAATVLLPGLLGGERRIDLSSAESARKIAGHDVLAELSRFSLFRFPKDGAVLREDGVPLPFPAATHADIAALGSGRYSVWNGFTVHWSSSDNTDPLANGRRYELAYEPDVLSSFPARALALAACVLAFLAWRAGGLELGGVSPQRTRLLATIVVVAALGAGLPKRWNAIVLQADSASYICHSHTRPLLYPAFIDALDREPEKPTVALLATKGGAVLDPGHRYLRVVQAQKVLTVLSLGILFFVLTSGLNVWVVAALAYLAITVDLAGSDFVPDAVISYNMGSLMSEGLNQPLVFLAFAALFAYLRSPRFAVGSALALVVSAMILTRPANAPFLSVFLVIALHHLARDGWRTALVRATALALVFAAPVLGACWQNYSKLGYFRLHSFSGMNVLCTALQTATVEDVAAFDDPETRAFLRACVVDEAGKRVPDYRQDPGGDFVNVNLHQIALPTFSRVVKVPPEKAHVESYLADDMFLAVGKKLIARHPAEFLGIVLFQLRQVLQWETHLPIAIALVLGAVLYARTRRFELLFFLFFAAIPLVSILPTCAFNCPLWRYRSQLYFAEVLAVPLLAAIIATLKRSEGNGAGEGTS